MSVKIKISYTTDKELAGIVRLLSPVMRAKRMSRNNEGKYKKAYIEIDKKRYDCVTNHMLANVKGFCSTFRSTC